MLYVLINNNYVINGPRNWNYHSFESTLEDDLEIITKLPIQKSDDTPIIIDENTKIVPANLIYPSHNSKIEYLDGPYWTFEENSATGTFEVKPKIIEYVKQDLISETAAVRYEKESAGLKVTIQNTEVTIDTSRGNRDIFVQKYVLMGDVDTVNWKFPECWMELTKTDLGIIVSAGAAFVQEQFNWEMDKIAEIDACVTLEELDAVVIREVVVVERPGPGMGPMGLRG